MNLSPNFTLEEAIVSQIASRLHIYNEPTGPEIQVMKTTAARMELVRALLKTPILINSWYRCSALNTAIGSKASSAHIRGEAVDFISPNFGSPLEICKFLAARASSIKFDQLILEHAWVHIAFNSNPSVKPRLQVLSLVNSDKYALGLTDKNGVPV